MKFLSEDEVIESEESLKNLNVMRFKTMDELDDFIRLLADESESFEEKVFMLGEAVLIQALINREATIGG